MLRFGGILTAIIIAAGLHVRAQDTTDITSGTIRLQRTPVAPFYKVEYYMRRVADPSKIDRRRVAVDTAAKPLSAFSADGERVKSKDPGNDTLTLERGEWLVHPATLTLLSEHYSKEITYYYGLADTPRVDTMRVGLWINKQGSVKGVYIRENKDDKMPRDLYDQVIGASLKLKKWGAPGGYWKRKRFLRKQEFERDNYYCDMYVIIASYPMNFEQKTSGARYTNRDICLNPAKGPVDKRRRKEKVSAEVPRSKTVSGKKPLNKAP